MQTILSVEGGGIRGIIPCCALVALESQTGKLTRDCISFVGGTSTGALLTAGVAAGVPASTMLEVYMGPQAEKIFSPSCVADQDVAMLAKGWCFDPQHLYDVLVEVLGQSAWSTINALSIPILITATDTASHDWYFVQDGPYNSGMTGETLLIDAATASACAPPYFTHRQVKIMGINNPSGTMRDLFDGGMGCLANPVFKTAQQVFQYSAHAPWRFNQIISLGTGWFADPNPKAPGDILSVIELATNALVDSSEDLMTQAARSTYPEVYLRIFNPQLPSNISFTDLSSRQALLEIGQAMAATMDWAKILA